MFLEDILLENDDDILEGEGFMESDYDLDLFSEALSLNGVDAGLQKVGLKKKPAPPTKKEKVIQAVKNVDKKKIAQILGVIAGALGIGAVIIVAAKKIKASKAAKDGQIDTKAVDEKVSITKKIMGKFQALRAKFSKAERAARKAERAAKKATNNEAKMYQNQLMAGGIITKEDISTVNKLTAIIKKIYNWFLKMGKIAGCKVAGAKDVVKNKFTKESALMDNADYAAAFESVMDGTMEQFSSYMESVELDAYLNDYVIEDVMSALESGAYDEEDDFDFDF